MAAAVRYDRSSIFRDAWTRARKVAAEAAEAVRLHIGSALRTAWASAKATLAPAKPAVPEQIDLVEYIAGLPPVSPARQHILGRIKANDVAMARLRHEIGRSVATGFGAGYVDAEQQRLDELHAWGVELQGELAALDVSEVAVACRPDLSTTEGLKAALVGLSASLPVGRGEAVYTVTDVTRWTAQDGTLVRDYVRVRLSGAAFDEAAGPVGIYIERTGGQPGRAALPMATRAGKAWWSYGKDCNAGGQRWAADKAVRSLLSVIDA